MAPIGAAWRACRLAHPEIVLLLDDRHPSDAGTYLTACVLYAVVYSKDPAELPPDLPGPKLPRAQTQTLRAIANQAVVEERRPREGG